MIMNVISINSFVLLSFSSTCSLLSSRLQAVLGCCFPCPSTLNIISQLLSDLNFYYPSNVNINKLSAAFFFCLTFFRAPGHRRNHRTERAWWIAVGWAAHETVRDAIALLVATWKQSVRHHRGHPVRRRQPHQFTLKFVHNALFKIHKMMIMISRTQ